MAGCCCDVPPEETESLLAKPHAGPFEMRGKTMDGWLRVEAEGVKTKRQLERWVGARRRLRAVAAAQGEVVGATGAGGGSR